MSSLPEKNREHVRPEGQGESDLVVFDLRSLASFRDGGPGVQVLSDIGVARMVLFAFQAGQQLKEHKTTSQILVQVVSGQITFTAQGKNVQLQAGMVLQLEGDVPHSLNAETEAVVLVTMTPSPSYHSLQKEVFEGLQPLVKRKEA